MSSKVRRKKESFTVQEVSHEKDNRACKILGNKIELNDRKYYFFQKVFDWVSQL